MGTGHGEGESKERGREASGSLRPMRQFKLAAGRPSGSSTSMSNGPTVTRGRFAWPELGLLRDNK
jgi:hypothetical protein